MFLGLRSGTESALDTRLLQLNAACDTGHEMIPVVYPIMIKLLIDIMRKLSDRVRKLQLQVMKHQHASDYWPRAQSTCGGAAHLANGA